MNPDDRWQLEVAALLAEMGAITVPAGTLEKHYAGQPVSEDEREMIDRCPEIAARLLGKIPRLEQVAAMVGGQRAPAGLTDPLERRGAELLRLAVALERQLRSGSTLAAVLDRLGRLGEHDPALLASLSDFPIAPGPGGVRVVQLRELATGMVLDEDVHSRNGTVVAVEGLTLTRLTIERLRNFARGVGVVEPIRVRL